MRLCKLDEDVVRCVHAAMLCELARHGKLINASWKPDANTVSICSLYTIEKRFSGNRESCHFWFRSREFAAKRELRSLFRPARGFFGGGGRQNSGFLLRFCLLRGPRGAFLKVAVDKIKAFCSVFVYFERRADRFSWRHASWGYRNARQMMLWNPRP